jgi:hypothetical protein
MRAAIGGELVEWNGTQFGTDYMFLECDVPVLKKDG